MYRRIIATVVTIIGLSMVILSGLSSSQAQTGQSADKNEKGRKLYTQYCASCHGVDGKGAGVVAPALKTAMPDLTTIAKREGKFDPIKVQQNISGEIGVTAHGDKDMPVWGYIFRHKGGNQSAATMNVYALMKYIESIQQK
jgi:mono/diheme cytochrome c family protein